MGRLTVGMGTGQGIYDSGDDRPTATVLAEVGDPCYEWWEGGAGWNCVLEGW